MFFTSDVLVKWLICLEFSPHKSRANEKTHSQTTSSLGW